MTQNRKIPAIVLAAGRSVRFGSGNKLCEKAGDISILGKTIENLKLSQCGEIIVVVGHDAPAIKRAASGLGVRFVENRAYKSGMGGSIREGVKALAETAPGVVIALGDMPLVKPETINRLIQAFAKSRGEKIFVPVFGSQRGNPALWDRAMFPELLALRQDTGGKNIIRENPRWVKEVPLEDPGILFDVDRAEDLAGVSL